MNDIILIRIENDPAMRWRWIVGAAQGVSACKWEAITQARQSRAEQSAARAKREGVAA